MFFRIFFIQPRVKHLLLAPKSQPQPFSCCNRRHVTRLRQPKTKNRFFRKKKKRKKKLPNSFKQVEITKESQGVPPLCDTFFRKPHEERILMGSFSTEHFGLRGRMGLTFSKKERKWRLRKTPAKMVANMPTSG